MNILVLTHEYPPIGGGGANACFFLAKELARSGNSITIITAQFGEDAQEEVCIENIQVYRVRCLRRNKETSSFLEMLTYLASAWVKAGSVVSKEHFDVCLTFFGIPSGPIALYLKKRYRLPYILRLGGGDIPGAQKRFKYIYKALGPVIHSIWKNAARLVANSEGLRERALQFENKYDIKIIENGVDCSFFFPVEKEPGEFIQILFVSRLIEGKGLQYIIPSLRDVKAYVKEKCGKPIRLTVIGDGPYRKNLEDIVRQTGNSDIVVFEGRKAKEQVRQYYQNADLFLLPSLSEGMPNVVLEAMACGLPILMTPCEGSRELVVDNGIISTLEDIPGGLMLLCTDNAMREKMARNSLSRVQSHFRWEAAGMKYLELIREQMGADARQRRETHTD